MERRNDDELTPTAEQAEDTAMRRQLARYGQPTPIAPPPDLVVRVLARLPEQAPAAAARAERQRRSQRRVLVGILLAGLLACLSLGGWGVFGNSSAPADLLGGVTTMFGQVVLLLVLAAKPLVNFALAPGFTRLALGTLTIIGAGWVWWQIVQHTPLARPLEI